jgi:RNA polymerase sigma-70 factor (ECF subfamily)
LRRFGVAERSIDDALQDVFLIAHRKLDGFEGRSTHRAWLFGIALRVAREHRRRDTRLQLDEAAVGAAIARPQTGIESRSEIERLDKILASLPDDQRAVFVMSEIEGFSAPEIADVLAVKLNTVYSRLRLARRIFERALARERRVEARPGK